MRAVWRWPTHIVVGRTLPMGNCNGNELFRDDVDGSKDSAQGTRYSSIEDALTNANFMLRGGAASVWIVDRVTQTGWIASSRPGLPLLGTRASPARFATSRRLAAASLH